MFNDIIIGQYIIGNSVIHRLDPRTKLILTILLIIILFMINNPILYLVFVAFITLVVKLSKIPPIYVLKGLKPMLFIVIFTVIINLFLTQGEPLFTLNLFSSFTITITKQGIIMSVLMFFRLFLLVSATSMLTLTTSPMLLTDGIENLLRPLRVIKVPSQEIAMMMSIAIRFIPTLAEETDKIKKAQTARGADFESGNILRRAKSMIPLLVPLFVSAFRRADELSVAMDARCYNTSTKRTRLKELHFSNIDLIAFLVTIAFVAIVFTIQYIMR